MKYFENCETRYIYRNTNIYIQFLETSHHPDLLRNKYDFEMYMLRMLEYGNVDNEFDKSMIKDEINQLTLVHLVMRFIMDFILEYILWREIASLKIYQREYVVYQKKICFVNKEL